MAGQHDLGTGRTGVVAKSRATHLTFRAGFELNGTEQGCDALVIDGSRQGTTIYWRL